MISLGFSDPVAAQYVGFLLHLTTGMVAGNIFGQISLFRSKIAPYSSKEDKVKGTLDGDSLDLSNEGNSCLYHAELPNNISDIALVNTSNQTLNFYEGGYPYATVS
jgi:hypothetical protein